MLLADPGAALPALSTTGEGSIVDLARLMRQWMQGQRSESAKATPQPVAARSGRRLRHLLLPALAQSSHVVSLVLDGFGERQLRSHVPHGAIAAARACSLDSVFPSSTAPAITTFATGLEPCEHANPGWFCWHEGIGEVVRTLPMDVRGDPGRSVDASELWQWGSMTQQAALPTFAIQPDAISDSIYSRHAWSGARRIGYRSLDDVPALVQQLVQATRRAWIWVYLPHFDTTAHLRGWASDEGRTVAQRFDRVFDALSQGLASANALLVATADHGFIDVPTDRQLNLEAYPRLKALLGRPLCGEPRTVYCQAMPGCEARFEQVAREEVGFAFDVFRTVDLVAAGWFGQAAVSPRLLDRIGSHVLVGRENWTLVDALPGEHGHRFIGMHGGIHVDERTVPLAAAYRGVIPTS